MSDGWRPGDSWCPMCGRDTPGPLATSECDDCRLDEVDCAVIADRACFIGRTPAQRLMLARNRASADAGPTAHDHDDPF